MFDMETIKCIIMKLTGFFWPHEEWKKRSESRRARIFDIENPVCTKDNQENCYDPTSIRAAFKPLALYAKIFGLFPRYDLSFVDKLEDHRIRVIHILDYIYSTLIFCIMTGGAILCTLKPPIFIRQMQQSKKDDQTDYFVNMFVVYLTMGLGVMSLFIFPMAGRKLLRLLDHFCNLDKILRFDGRSEERCFARRTLIYMVVIFIGTLIAYIGLYLVEIREKDGNSFGFSDYSMPFVMAVSGTTLLIPTGLVLFFLHAIRIRLYHYNKLIESLILPAIPSCFACLSYSDYGGELDKQSFEDKSPNLAKDLEKLRILYTEFACLVKEVGCIFGTHLTRDFLFSILGLILYTYFIIYMNDNTPSNLIIYIILDTFLVFKLLVMSSCAQRIICFGSRSKSMLRKVSLLRMSPDCQLQVQMFVNALETPMEISASGYFTIDRRLITSILGSITTYFIILIQFKVGDVKSDLREVAGICANSTTKDVTDTFFRQFTY